MSFSREEEQILIEDLHAINEGMTQSDDIRNQINGLIGNYKTSVGEDGKPKPGLEDALHNTTYKTLFPVWGAIREYISGYGALLAKIAGYGISELKFGNVKRKVSDYKDLIKSYVDKSIEKIKSLRDAHLEKAVEDYENQHNSTIALIGELRAL